MQKNDFEKQVQQQLEDFSLPPAEAVWQKVEARVQQDKRRRRLIFWMFAAILLAGGATGLWLINNDGENKVIASATKNADHNTNDKKIESVADNYESNTADVNDDAEKITKEDKKVDPENEPSVNDEKTLAKTEARIKTSHRILKKNEQRLKTAVVRNTDQYKIEEKKNDNHIIIDQQTKPLTSNVTDELTSAISDNVERSELKSEVKTDAKPEVKTELNQSTETIENKVVPVKNKPEQKANALLFGATLLMGISDNRTSSLLNMNKSADRAPLFASSPGTGQSFQGSAIFIPRYNYSSSFSWGAGVFVQKPVTGKMAVSAGLNYHLMSANIAVGTRVDSVKTFQDSVLNKSTTVASFYRAGESGEHRSKYHLLELPINVLFQLNRNENKPFTLSAGLTAGFLAGSNVMYLNNKARSFYEEEDHLKRFSISGQTAVSFTLLNSNKYRLQAGPHVQYQFSNLTKSIINTNEHLLFFGLKGNLLFKSLK